MSIDAAAVVARARAGYDAGLIRGIEARKAQLRQLHRLLSEGEDALLKALAADLGKPAIEAYSTEIGFTLNEVDHALAHLDAWVRPARVRVPANLRPGRAWTVPEPLGVVAVIAPWNYPVQLAFGPMVAALAAGNAVVLKPSEISAATSDVLAELVPRYLDERITAVVTGGPEATTELLTERFDHILYTGGGAVGRIVLHAAAQHLTPVTLELGGKSPAIVAADADLAVAARRIAWGKFVNAGQTCVAPDYVLVDRRVHDRFVQGVGESVRAFYGTDPRRSEDYGRIVNQRHVDRLAGLLAAGGYEHLVLGGEHDVEDRYVAPTVVTGVAPDAPLMQDEIFGPILPVLAVDGVEEAIAFVDARPKPLALYVFSASTAVQQRVVERTTSGSVAVNHVMLQVGVPALPFGGVGASGMGAYHGKTGFDTFTHHKAVLTKPSHPDPKLLYPPYGRVKRWVVRKFV
jgi:aldehyde dehydrogenase (NAD+)